MRVHEVDESGWEGMGVDGRAWEWMRAHENT